MEKIQVFIVDDHAIVVEGLTLCLRNEPDLHVCGHAKSAHEGLEAIDENKPDCVIVDLSLEKSQGLDLIKDIQVLYPRLPIVVLSMHDESIYAERVIRAGAMGYVMKNQPFSKVIEAIRCVLKGEIFLSREIRYHIIDSLRNPSRNVSSNGVNRLTDRELEILNCIGEGLRPRHIADKLNISVSTVNTYCKRIKEKLDLENMAQVAQQAVLIFNKNLPSISE